MPMMRRTVLNAEHEAFRLVVRDLLVERVVPTYADWEREGRPPREFWKQAAAAGILGIGVPPEFGGLAGSDFRHSVVVTEEAQRLFLALGGLRVHTDICMPYFLHYASPEQKRRWLPRLVNGEAVVALALSEPGAGSDLKAMATRAVVQGDDYIVDGSKTFISNGAAADLLIVAVKTNPDAGRHGISLLVVEAPTDGFARGRNLEKLGLKAQDLAELSFTGMRVPRANLLGVENEGFAYLTSNLAQERLSIAINSQAAATSVLAASVSGLRGHEPTQHEKFELAACAAEVEAGQTLVDTALGELVFGELSGAAAAVAKLYCTELQSRVAERCLQLFPPGRTPVQVPIARAYLDGRVSRIYGGSSEIMKVLVAQGLDL